MKKFILLSSYRVHNRIYRKDRKQSLCSRAHWKAKDHLFWFLFEKVVDTIWLLRYKEKNHCKKRFKFYHKVSPWEK